MPIRQDGVENRDKVYWFCPFGVRILRRFDCTSSIEKVTRVEKMVSKGKMLRSVIKSSLNNNNNNNNNNNLFTLGSIYSTIYIYNASGAMLPPIIELRSVWRICIWLFNWGLRVKDWATTAFVCSDFSTMTLNGV